MNDPWVVSESPWSQGARMDDTTRTYIQIGFIGAIIGILSSIFGIFQLYLIFFGSHLYEIVVLVSLATLPIVSIETVLFGIGFLGLAYKYTETSCKAVFYLSIVEVMVNGGYNLFAFLANIPAYESIIVFILMIQIVGFVWTLSIVLAVWRIAKRTPRPDVSKLFALTTLAGPVVSGIIGIPAMMIVMIATALVTVYFFQLERFGGVKRIISSW